MLPHETLRLLTGWFDELRTLAFRVATLPGASSVTEAGSTSTFDAFLPADGATMIVAVSALSPERATTRPSPDFEPRTTPSSTFTIDGSRLCHWILRPWTGRPDSV